MASPLTIDAGYDDTLVVLPGPDYIIDATGTVVVGTDAGPVGLRPIFRFAIPAEVAGKTVTLAKLLLTIWQVSGGEDREQYVGPYHLDGLADPELDDGATQGARSNIGATSYVTTSDLQSIGNKEIDITAGAAAHIAAAADATFALVVMQTDETTDATKQAKTYGEDEEGVTLPDHIPQLYVEYEDAPPPGGGGDGAGPSISADGGRWGWR